MTLESMHELILASRKSDETRAGGRAQSPSLESELESDASESLQAQRASVWNLEDSPTLTAV